MHKVRNSNLVTTHIPINKYRHLFKTSEFNLVNLNTFTAKGALDVALKDSKRIDLGRLGKLGSWQAAWFGCR